VAADVAAVPGVAAVSPVKLLPGLVNGQAAALVGIDPATYVGMANLDFTAGSLADLGTDGMAVDTNSATANGLKMGDVATVQLPSGAADFRVVGLYKPAGAFSGYVVRTSSLATEGVKAGDSFIYAAAADGADLSTVQDGITKALVDFPTVQVLSQAEFKQQITSSVDQLLLVMIMLLSLAILIAVLGIVNTLALSVVERTREIGMLRAVGAQRRQIRWMVVLEAFVIALFGAVVGLGLGVWFAVALQRTLVEQGIEVLDIPWTGLLVFLVLAGIVGVLAALWPAFRAGRLNVLAAISAE
jgi:putative ABC transport system permease protein